MSAARPHQNRTERRALESMRVTVDVAAGNGSPCQVARVYAVARAPVRAVPAGAGALVRLVPWGPTVKVRPWGLVQV